MKHSKRLQTCVGIVVWIIVVCMVTPLNTMISEKSTSKRIRVRQSDLTKSGVFSDLATSQIQPERYKNKLIWVRTSDNVRMELPEWQIDQMKAVQHKSAGTQYHWVEAPMITSGELVLVQKALNFTDNLKEFEEFYIGLSHDQKENLINSASKLGMQGLTSLLMIQIFPMDVQQQIGAMVEQVSGVIAPVVEYLKKGQILKGHKGIVCCVAYSPDGNYIVSGSQSNDNNLILWNSRTGEKIKILKGHQDLVNCVAYSPDGNYIVSGSRDNDLILWNGKTGDQIKILKGHTKPVRCVAYSPNGEYIVSGSGGVDILILWNGKTGDQIQILKGYTGIVNCVAYSPDGDYIVSGANDKLTLWDGKTGEQIKILKGHTSWISCVAYSPDGNYIISGSSDNLILWDGKTGKKIEIFKKCSSSVTCVAWSPNGNHIVTGLLGGELILWNFIDSQVLDYIATKLDIAQARFLYRLYQGQINKVPVALDRKDADYQIYLSLPKNVQKVVDVFLSFEMSEKFIEQEKEKQIQKKMNEYRSSLHKTGASLDDKIKALKILMKDFDKNSVEYQAGARLLDEFELQAALEM